MFQPRRIGLGFGAALLLTASLPAAESAPPRDGARDNRQVQPDRSRGFYGFPDWDSRSGRYDRSRREDPRDADRRPEDPRARPTPDARQPGGPPGQQPGRGFPGPGFGTPGRPGDLRGASQDDVRRLFEQYMRDRND